MSRVTTLIVCAGLIVGTASLAGCKGNKDTSTASAAKADTCWNRLGGEKNVRAVVDDFVDRCAKDDKNVNFFRKGLANVPEWKPKPAQVENLKVRLVELISSGTGGPLSYKGKDMKSSHKGMKITKAEFMALAGHLEAALKKGGASPADTAAVVNFAAGTMNDIVEVQ